VYSYQDQFIQPSWTKWYRILGFNVPLYTGHFGDGGALSSDVCFLLMLGFRFYSVLCVYVFFSIVFMFLFLISVYACFYMCCTSCVFSKHDVNKCIVGMSECVQISRRFG